MPIVILGAPRVSCPPHVVASLLARRPARRSGCPLDWRKRDGRYAPAPPSFPPHGGAAHRGRSSATLPRCAPFVALPFPPRRLRRRCAPSRRGRETRAPAPFGKKPIKSNGKDQPRPARQGEVHTVCAFKFIVSRGGQGRFAWLSPLPTVAPDSPRKRTA